MDQITVSTAADQVNAVTHFVNGHLEKLGCSERVMIQVDVAVDEIFSNIAHYAYSQGTGPVTVGVETEKNPPAVAVTFIDCGIPYDPLAREMPDTTRLPKEERPIGGLGLYLVKKTMDHVSYTCQDGHNILTIRKKI